MTREEFKITLEARLAKLLEVQTFDEISFGGIPLNFEMSLGIGPGGQKLPEGLDGQDFEGLLEEKEHVFGKYDNIIQEVFNKAYDEDIEAKMAKNT